MHTRGGTTEGVFLVSGGHTLTRGGGRRGDGEARKGRGYGVREGDIVHREGTKG